MDEMAKKVHAFREVMQNLVSALESGDVEQGLTYITEAIRLYELSLKSKTKESLRLRARS